MLNFSRAAHSTSFEGAGENRYSPTLGHGEEKERWERFCPRAKELSKFAEKNSVENSMSKGLGQHLLIGKCKP